MQTQTLSSCGFARGFLMGLAVLAAAQVTARTGYAQEFRSIEITSWNSGFESASAVTSMVNYADSCNLNCVIPEIRLRCDAYYTSSIEPPGTGVAISPAGFDSLADIIAKAHPLNIKVMPWLVTFRIWSTVDPRYTPGHYSPVEHIWWTHGPGNTDPNQDWMMYSDSGAWDYGGVVNLDPGHPAVENYLISVFMDIVNRYDVDGLNLDYIRYPATNWGYNPKAVANFNWDYGRAGNPSSSDTTWQNWRRDQITNLVKRLYLEIKAVKPWVQLNADVWNSAATGNASYFQNWDNWMLNHWMDFAHPMSYTSTNSEFDGWCDAYVGNQHGRHVYPLVSVANSVTGNVIPQINSARAHGLPGVGLYSYQNIPNRSALQSALVAAGGPFPTKVSPPDLPWLTSPTLGMLKGFVRNAGGNGIYPATVTIQSKSTKNTGTGFYGFVDLNTGTYTVNVSAPGYLSTSGDVTITAGVVSNLDFTLAPDITPPVISNVRTANVQATNVQILWDTNEIANGQVEYGLTGSYGSQSTLDPAWLTAHTVQLISLSPLTTYHYRVKSRDAGNNLTISGDYTFTTGSGDIVADIIVDNSDPAPKFQLTGSWTNGTSASDKYGTSYHYCTESTSETKSARWTPSIITAGNYNVYVWYPDGGNRATNARYIVYYNGGSTTTFVNQQNNGGQWNLIASNKPFLVGSAGYIKISNDTDQTGTLQVMADAVRLQYADAQAPTVPTGVTATAAATTSIQLNWTASTDNVGVTGYKIWRDGVNVGTSTTTSYTDNGRTPNTGYSYTISAYDGANNQSAQSSPAVSRTTLSVPPSTSTVTCDRPAGSWYATDEFVFTAVGGFGGGTASKYLMVWDANPTCSWQEGGDDWNGGTLTQHVGTAGVRYLHLKGFNSEDVENGTLDLGPYGFDDATPAAPAVTDDGASTSSMDTLHATWSAAPPASGVKLCEYRIRAQDDTIVRDWTGAGTGTEVTATGLTLIRGITYFIDVRVTSNADLVSEVGSSDGIVVFPFDVEPNGHVDDTDFEFFSNCAMGANVPYATGQPVNCGIFDMEPDGDVDQDDFAAFQRCYSGATDSDPSCLQ